MPTRPKSVAEAIEIATELFSDGLSSVRVVTDKSTKEESKLASRVQSLKNKLDKILQALEKSNSKRTNTKQGGKRDAHGRIICYACGEEGHVKQFCTNNKKKKAESLNVNNTKDKVLEN